MENELVKPEKTEENTNSKENEEARKTQEELEERIRKLEKENDKLRQANTNASADASKWKKQFQDKLSEEERNKITQEEDAAKLREELETLRTERNVANYKARFISLGFEEENAQEVATALNGGDLEKVFEGLRQFVAAHDKQLKENAFRNNKTLPGGDSGKAITKEQFDRMSYRERLEVFNQHPELYQEFTK